MPGKRPRLHWLALGVATAITTALLVLSLLPPGTAPKQHGWDKWGHALAYAALVVAWWSALRGFLDRPRTRWLLIPLLCAAVWLLGLGVEMVQPYVDRGFRPPDIAANTIGIGLAGIATGSWTVFRGKA